MAALLLHVHGKHSDVKADLTLCWLHRLFCWFSLALIKNIMSKIFLYIQIIIQRKFKNRYFYMSS